MARPGPGGPAGRRRHRGPPHLHGRLHRTLVRAEVGDLRRHRRLAVPAAVGLRGRADPGRVPRPQRGRLAPDPRAPAAAARRPEPAAARRVEPAAVAGPARVPAPAGRAARAPPPGGPPGHAAPAPAHAVRSGRVRGRGLLPPPPRRRRTCRAERDGQRRAPAARGTRQRRAAPARGGGNGRPSLPAAPASRSAGAALPPPLAAPVAGPPVAASREAPPPLPSPCRPDERPGRCARHRRGPAAERRPALRRGGAGGAGHGCRLPRHGLLLRHRSRRRSRAARPRSTARRAGSSPCPRRTSASWPWPVRGGPGGVGSPSAGS